MGTLTTYRHNTGPQGTGITTGNDGATDIATTGTLRFDSAAAGEGPFGVTAISVAGSSTVATYPFDVPGKIGVSEICFHTPTAAPNVDDCLVEWRSAAGGLVVKLMYTASGILYIQGRGGSTAKTIATSVPLNTQYDISMVMSVGVATVAPFDGVFTAKVYRHSDRVVLGTVTDSAYNLGTNTIDWVRMGISVTALTSSMTHKWDTIRWEDGRTTELGVFTAPANNPPVIAAISPKSTPVSTATTVTAVGSDTDGTISSYSWQVISYPGSTAPTLANSALATVTVTPTATPGTIVLGVTAQDNGGATSSQRLATVYVTAAAGSTVSAGAVISNAGGWGYGGTATDLVDGLSDAGEWVLTSAGPTGAELIVGLPPQPDNDATFDFYVDLVKADGTTLADVGQTGTITAQVFAGATAISDVVTTAVSGTEAHVVITLNSAQNTAFTAAGRMDPRVRFLATAV